MNIEIKVLPNGYKTLSARVSKKLSLRTTYNSSFSIEQARQEFIKHIAESKALYS